MNVFKHTFIHSFIYMLIILLNQKFLELSLTSNKFAIFNILNEMVSNHQILFVHIFYYGVTGRCPDLPKEE